MIIYSSSNIILTFVVFAIVYSSLGLLCQDLVQIAAAFIAYLSPATLHPFFLFFPFHLFHLSSRLCPSTAGCSPPSMSVLCLLLLCSRWFPPSLLCRLGVFYLVFPNISSLSLVATLCSVYSTLLSFIFAMCLALPLLFQCIMSVIFVLSRCLSMELYLVA